MQCNIEPTDNNSRCIEDFVKHLNTKLQNLLNILKQT